jgi:hypothetical protein
MSQLSFLKIYAQPEEKFDFDGQSIPVRVFKIIPANEMFYIDHQGRLMKAFDLAQQISVVRLAEGKEATIARRSLIGVYRDRLPGYFALLIVAAIWFVGFGYGQVKRLDLYVLFLVGALLYWLSLLLLNPIQKLYFGFALDPANPTSSYVFLFGFALIIGVVEEASKYVPILSRSLIAKSFDLRLALSIGAACGAGFGFLQAANLTAFNGDGTLLIRSDLFQKFFLIGINAGTGAFLALLIASKKPFAYYLIPIGLKTLFNWLIVFVQKGIMTSGLYTFMTIFFAAVIIVLDYRFYKQLQERKHRQAVKQE